LKRGTNNQHKIKPSSSIKPSAAKSKDRKFWLMKTEPDVFSIDDLRNAPNQTTCWDGVRNYQARNFMRDQMKLGDGVLVYHSNANPSCVVGTATIVRTAYPDHTAWDKHDPHHDPKCDPANPRWFMVDIQYESSLPQPLSLEMLRQIPSLESMELLRKGSRLSVQPVTKQQFDTIIHFALPNT
jgi:predicted RNA-binding protein with PUA-like domain